MCGWLLLERCSGEGVKLFKGFKGFKEFKGFKGFKAIRGELK